MRYHKRLTNNVMDKLQSLIDNEKQSTQIGMTKGEKVTINYIDVNRSGSLVKVWWSKIKAPIEASGKN